MDKIKKTFHRTTHEVQVKMGRHEETVDIQLNQEAAKFKAHYKHLEKINDDAKKFMTLMKDLQKAQSKLTEDIHSLFEATDPMYQGSVQLQYSMQDADAARLALEEQWRDDFQGPLSEYLGQFHEMEKRLEKRGKRRVDMDRYREDVKSLTEKNKDPQKLTIAKEKLANMQEAYKELNSELLVDIPALYSD